jgi:hypothetical protein
MESSCVSEACYLFSKRPVCDIQVYHVVVKLVHWFTTQWKGSLQSGLFEECQYQRRLSALQRIETMCCETDVGWMVGKQLPQKNIQDMTSSST